MVNVKHNAMRYIIFLFVILTACAAEQVEPSSERLPCVEVWRNAQVERDSLAFDGGWRIDYRVKNGPNAGYLHSPKDVALFAVERHTTYNGRVQYVNYAADDRFSNVTDIAYKVRGKTYWRPAKVTVYADGHTRVERYLNRMRNDNQGPAIVEISAEGDTISRTCYNCDILVPCP